MKCPKCGYISFEYLDDCNRCEKDLTRHKKRFSISAEKHGFINILKYVELENTPGQDFNDTESEVTEETIDEIHASGREIQFGSERNADAPAEPEVEAVTSGISDSFENMTGASEILTEAPPPAESPPDEIQMEEVSITFDDIHTPEERVEPAEILLDEPDSMNIEEIQPDNADTDSLRIEEIDLSDTLVAEAPQPEPDVFPPGDRPAELKGVEITLDPEEPRDIRKEGEIEFSPEDIEPGKKTDFTGPAEITEEVSAAIPENPVLEDNTISNIQAETPRIDEEENQPADTGLNFSLDDERTISTKGDEQTGSAAANEDDLELSLDEFDNFSINMEDFDLRGDVPLKSESRDSGSSKEASRKGDKKPDEKKPEDRTLDIDLDDLYLDN